MSESSDANSRLDGLQKSALRWGWPRALFNVLIGVSARYLGIHLYIIRIRPIPTGPVYPATNPDLVFRKISLDELTTASDDPELDLDSDFVAKAIARGDLSFGAFDGPLLVSYIWRSVNSAPDANDVWVRIPKPYNYSYKSYTRPGYRGQRISPVVHLFSDNEMRKLGYDYRIGFVTISNYSSVKMGKHMGSIKIGYAGYLLWFGRLRAFRTQAVKKTGLEFFQPKQLG
jgi:hypothetical protein